MPVAANGTQGRVEYRIIRPPGWIHIPLDDDADDAARAIAGRIASGAPAQNRVQVKALFEEQIGSAIAAARENGGQDFYLPTELVDGLPLAMSIVVAVSPPREESGASASESLLGFASGDDSATAATVGNQLAVRRFLDVPARRNAEGGVEQPASRQITYLTTPPDDDRLMLVTAGILRLDVPDGDKLLEAMEFLFDSMVTTLRFGAPEATA